MHLHPPKKCHRLRLKVGRAVAAGRRVLKVVTVEILMIPGVNLTFARRRKLRPGDARPQGIVIVVHARVRGRGGVGHHSGEAGAAKGPATIQRADLDGLRAPGAGLRRKQNMHRSGTEENR